MRYYYDRFMQYANINEKKNIVQLFYLGSVYFYCYLRYRVTISEFYIYKFYLLNHKGRKTFVTNRTEKKYYKKNNKPEYAYIMDSKEETFQCYAPYIRRDWCGIKYHNSLEYYQEFLNKHSKGILKPNIGSHGRGIEIVEFSQGDAQYWNKYCADNQMIIEELIIQHSELNLLHADSINTIRVVTHLGEVVSAILRIGIHGSIVDNVGAGGITAMIDVDTGIVISKAVNRNYEQFVMHPDTECVILGKQIPMWNEILELIREASNIVTNIPTIGWDVAVTPECPIIVEVNARPNLYGTQMHRLIEFGEKLM